MNNIKKFIHDIAKTPIELIGNSENLYNPTPQYGKIRAHNLELYLNQMHELAPTLLLLGEAPGYKGCGLTGVPFSSEKIVKTNTFFTNQAYKLVDPSKLESEQSATIVWNFLNTLKQPPLIWNIFPFHPYKGNNIKSNRTPNEMELEMGKKFVLKLLNIFNIKHIIAVGRKPEQMLKDLNISYEYVRHPANGGKNKFIEGINNVYANQK